jgi:hypothetical protein
MRVKSGDDVVILDDAHDKSSKNTIVVVIEKGKS